MSSIKDFVRSITPQFILTLFRKQKKAKRNAQLESQKWAGEGLTKEDLILEFKKNGLSSGDTVLVHSALSRIGYISGGPQTFIDAILEVVGEKGNVLMPNSPNGKLQLEYVKTLDLYDVNTSQSSLGKITEVFRNQPGAVRSLNATEPVSCIGKDAQYLTENHNATNTPYGKNSPWYKITEFKGKILYIGCTLANAGTSLHCLEDAVDNFKFPVYFEKEFEVRLKDKDGNLSKMYTKVHNPTYSQKRRCDELIPMFIKENVAKEVMLGEAHTLIFDAKKMLDVMLEKYNKNGITMYTPEGSN